MSTVRVPGPASAQVWCWKKKKKNRIEREIREMAVHPVHCVQPESRRASQEPERERE